MDAEYVGKNNGSAFISSIKRHPILFIVILGMALRLILGVFLTYNFDVSHWAQIVENIRSGNGLYELDGYYYTPPWGYMLAFFSAIGDMLGVGDLGTRFLEALAVEDYHGWHISATVTSISFNLLEKVPIFLADLGVAYVIRSLVIDRTGDAAKGTKAFALWFLCPLTIIVGANLGMFDGICALLILLCIMFLRRDRCFFAGVLFSAAVLLKFFPAFFLFVLVAYVLVRHRGDGKGARKVLEAIAGATLMLLVIMLPNIIEGNVTDTIAFLTNRAGSGLGAGFGVLEAYGTMAAYLGFLVISALLGYRFWKVGEGSNLDDRFMLFMFFNALLIFLYPSTPQYILVLLPFLIYHMVVRDTGFKLQYAVLTFGSTMFALSSNAMLFLSAAAAGLVSIDWVMPLADAFQQSLFLGITGMDILYFGGGVIQYIATVMMVIGLYMRLRNKARSSDAVPA
jgi:uncharacterized membrane protein